MEKFISKAETLIEALPYLQKYRDKVFVFKYGGHAMTDPALKESFLRDIVALKHFGIKPVLVHGGGPQIEEALGKFGIEPKYADGLRVTDAETMKVVEMVLVGRVGSEIVRELNRLGGEAVGLSGQDGHMIVARRMPPHRGADGQPVDLGEVGAITRVETGLITRLCHENRFIPVVSPVAVSEQGRPLNVNADAAASEIAVALKAEKLVFLTDTGGVLDKAKNLITNVRVRDVEKLIGDGTVNGGMMPKLRGAADAVKRGAGSVAIIDGRVPHAVLLEIFTDKGVGTLIHD